MHPYKMQRLIKDRGKDQVINVEQRASLYQTINQLLREGLIASWETNRPEGFPERTLYKLTDLGHETTLEWMREMLSTPASEFPEFPAAVSVLPLLLPEEVIQQLEIRTGRLTEKIAALEQDLQTYAATLPRLFLLETEYMKRILETELEWVRSIIADLQSGQLTWHHDWLKPDVPPENET